MIQTVTASQVREGDSIPGLDNGYVFEEPETNDGYFTYPSGSGGYSAAMPSDTILISYHDADGQECYLLLPSDARLTISHDGPERSED